MDSHRNAWDADYRCRGRLWGGCSPDKVRFVPASRILELGCGNGKTASSLVRAGCSVTAIDNSPCAALLCRNACPDPDHARILVADVQKIPFCSGSFDGISASHVTGHLTREGRRQMAREVFRLLVPQGILHFSDFSTGDFRFGKGVQTEEGTYLRKNGISTHYFTGEEVRALFSCMAEISLEEHQWEMRVRDTVLPRAEIVAVFRKPA